MEKEANRTVSLEAINPPRLEDAGLEDCALPLESILEAFSKAASISSVSRFSNSVDDASEGEDEGSEVDQIRDGGERSPVQEVKRDEDREGREGTGGEALVMRTGHGGGRAEADEKK
jgi:hypothetical protein